MKDKILSIINKKNISYDVLLNITVINEEELNKILRESVSEEKIFLNSSLKYQVKNDELFVCELDRNSKGVNFVIVDGKKYIVLPEDLHTALKYDKVVVEIIY